MKLVYIFNFNYSNVFYSSITLFYFLIWIVISYYVLKRLSLITCAKNPLQSESEEELNRTQF